MTEICEVIVFTYLPKQFVDILIEKEPELSHYISHFLTFEDMKEMQGAFLKDLSPLLHDRKMDNLVVSDLDPDCIEHIDLNFVL